MRVLFIATIINFYFFKGHFSTSMLNNNNVINGEWIEAGDNTTSGSAEFFKIIFFPGGKLNVMRKLHNYIGYYELNSVSKDLVSGNLVLGQKFPFVASFINDKTISLSFTYKGHTIERKLFKTKNFTSPFHFIK